MTKVVGDFGTNSQGHLMKFNSKDEFLISFEEIASDTNLSYISGIIYQSTSSNETNHQVLEKETFNFE